MLGSTLAQLSKHMPSAGGYYTYVSRALHPRLGFLTSWMYILYSPVTGGPVAGFFGFIVQGELKSNWNIDIPWLWWVTILVFCPLTAYLQWRGIKLSARFMLITGGLEMIIVMALALTGFIDPPTGTGITLNVFNPSFIPAGEGFALAVVFTVQGLTGWEASAPLAEETKNPRRNVPLSVYLSIILIGTFLVIVFWGVITGFGNDADAIAKSPELPALALAHRVWGAGWIIILIAFLNSVARGPDRLRQRRHPDVVRHGPQRVIPQAARQGRPGPQDPDQRDPARDGRQRRGRPVRRLRLRTGHRRSS